MPKVRRQELEESARLMRSRLTELETRVVADHERPIHEVALAAVRDTLTQIGRQLVRVAAA